ncbi:MAG: 50S ribosomal protein L35 [Myxococcota bacterium]
MGKKIKMRTNRSASKRFRLTGTGKIRRSKAGGNHGLSNKNRKRLRRLRDNDTVASCMEKRIKKQLIPYG